ncbi:MAG: hypothetical protein OJF49_001754 [Ktedonobacterales bacterium]|nr:MAG: hypothetical protein OJF49_001754 [Ktedonobacterales bacterium]
MFVRYPAAYRDVWGEEITTIENDSKLLRMRVRGAEFTGSSFDSLEAPHDATEAQLSSFTLMTSYKMLCSCCIDCDIPIKVVAGNECMEATLHMHLDLGSPRPNGRIEHEYLQLTLAIGDATFISSGKSGGWFEDELGDIQRALPEGMYTKSCINCAFSDYSIFGQGMFGDMACFRDNRQAYLAARGKREFMRIWDTKTEQVQETYLCPEFQRRTPGTGYRG